MRFTKLTGAGNDFILVERSAAKGSAKSLARRLCSRRTSIGADGLLVLTRLKGKAAAELEYYNADGSLAFCGNGTRAAAMWVYQAGWAKKSFKLKTREGDLDCRILSKNTARVRLPDPKHFKLLTLSAEGKKFKVAAIDTGVPHAVVFVSDKALAALNVSRYGRALRRHPAFHPQGANANFVAVKSKTLYIRTYERGVEAETLACGTGITAAALACGRPSPVKVVAKSGDGLTVFYKRVNGGFSDVWLEGPVRVIYEGETR